MHLLAKFKKILYMEFRATLKFRKSKEKEIKVAQNSFQHFPRRLSCLSSQSAWFLGR